MQIYLSFRHYTIIQQTEIGQCRFDDTHDTMLRCTTFTKNGTLAFIDENGIAKGIRGNSHVASNRNWAIQDTKMIGAIRRGIL